MCALQGSVQKHLSRKRINNKYDVEIYITFIRSTKENICINLCLVRRSCSIGQSLRKIEQSKFHMKYFINEDKL